MCPFIIKLINKKPEQWRIYSSVCWWSFVYFVRTPQLLSKKQIKTIIIFFWIEFIIQIHYRRRKNQNNTIINSPTTPDGLTGLEEFNSQSVSLIVRVRVKSISKSFKIRLEIIFYWLGIDSHIRGKGWTFQTIHSDISTLCSHDDVPYSLIHPSKYMKKAIGCRLNGVKIS